MTRVLLVDTSFAARPIHDWLLEQGFEVWTIGNRPSDPLAQRDSERYLQDNYADVSIVQAHIDRLGITYVVPGCTDLSIETALRLSMPVPSLDTPTAHYTLTDKVKFRALCARLNLPSPRLIAPSDLPIAGKVIAKPADSFSGRGISVVDGTDRQAALQALEAARHESRTAEALLETFAEGQLHSYSAFIEDQQVADAVFVHESGSVTPFAVDTSHVAFDFPASGEAALKTAVERIADDLKLVDGLVHVQFIWDGKAPSIVEASRRCPGDLYSNLIELSTGRRYAGRYASYFVERPAPENRPAARRHILRHTVTAGHQNYEGLWMRTPLPLVEFHPLATVGRQPPPLNRIDRVALLFAEYATLEELTLTQQIILRDKNYDTCAQLRLQK